jgi:hypothetical protein
MQRWEKMANDQLEQAHNLEKIKRELMEIGIQYGQKIAWRAPFVVDLGGDEYMFKTPQSPGSLCANSDYEFLPNCWRWARVEYDDPDYSGEVHCFHRPLTHDQMIRLHRYLTEDVSAG